jgi:hypothetical protein
MKWSWKAVVAACVLAACLTPQSSAHACTPPPNWTPPSPAARFAAADVVVRGRVLAVDAHAELGHVPPHAEQSQPLSPEVGVMHQLLRYFYGHEPTLTGRRFSAMEQGYYAVVAVEHYLKGDGPGHLIVRGFGYGPDCLNSAIPGAEYIYFTGGSVPFLNALYVGPWTALIDASAANLEALSRASDDPPRIPDATRRHMWLPLLATAGALTLLSIRAAGRLALRSSGETRPHLILDA